MYDEQPPVHTLMRMAIPVEGLNHSRSSRDALFMLNRGHILSVGESKWHYVADSS